MVSTIREVATVVKDVGQTECPTNSTNTDIRRGEKNDNAALRTPWWGNLKQQNAACREGTLETTRLQRTYCQLRLRKGVCER